MSSIVSPSDTSGIIFASWSRRDWSWGIALLELREKPSAMAPLTDSPLTLRSMCRRMLLIWVEERSVDASFDGVST